MHGCCRYGQCPSTRRYQVLVCLTDVTKWTACPAKHERDKSKEAQQIADKWEAATRGRVTARQTQRVIAESYRDVTGQHLVFPTVREYFDSWVARKKPEIAPSSHHFYHEKDRDLSLSSPQRLARALRRSR